MMRNNVQYSAVQVRVVCSNRLIVYQMPIRTTTLSRMRQMMTSALNEANLLEYLLRLSSCSSCTVASASADSPTSATGAPDSRGALTATLRAPLLPVGCVYQLLSARSGSGTGSGGSVSSASALVSRASSSAMTPTTPSAAASRCESPFEDPFGFAFGLGTTTTTSAHSLDPSASTPTRIPLRDWLLRYMLDASLERLDPQLPALIEAFTRLSVSAPLGGASGSNDATPLKTFSAPSNRFGISYKWMRFLEKFHLFNIKCTLYKVPVLS